MKKWILKDKDLACQKTLSDALGLSGIISQLLINRNLKDIDKARTFLFGDTRELYSPFLMEGVHEAVGRIKKAINNKESVLIHGDYDVDGITAIAVLIFTLREFGLEPYYYIPDRLTEGYGLGMAGVREAVRRGAGLLITVDCGISSHKEIDELNKHGIDVIITDHHEPPKKLPCAHSIVNPHQSGCPYPDKNLSGVAIAFKLCEALSLELTSNNFWRHLDLVSLGTVSDVVPLVGENRILVKEGFKRFENNQLNKGVKALIEVSRLHKRKVGSFEIGYILGPRINASGRLGSAGRAIELFLTDDYTRALRLAKELDKANRERQKIENLTLKEAMDKTEREVNFKEHRVIVLHKEDWHSGVIGIVASRLTDRFYRPTILISTKDGIGRGSGRSIENFHLFEALASCEEFLEEYGGHQYACGLTILEENLVKFTNLINERARSILSSEDLVPFIDVDMEIELASLDYVVLEDIARLEPFGEGNPEPLFCSRNLRVLGSPRILKGEHIKFCVTDGKKNFEAIGFGLAKEGNLEYTLQKHTFFDLLYRASLNTWQGLDTIELRVEDIRPSGSFRP